MSNPAKARPMPRLIHVKPRPWIDQQMLSQADAHSSTCQAQPMTSPDHAESIPSPDHAQHSPASPMLCSAHAHQTSSCSAQPMFQRMPREAQEQLMTRPGHAHNTPCPAHRAKPRTGPIEPMTRQVHGQPKPCLCPSQPMPTLVPVHPCPAIPSPCPAHPILSPDKPGPWQEHAPAILIPAGLMTATAYNSPSPCKPHTHFKPMASPANAQAGTCQPHHMISPRPAQPMPSTDLAWPTQPIDRSTHTQPCPCTDQHMNNPVHDQPRPSTTHDQSSICRAQPSTAHGQSSLCGAQTMSNP